jgi:hypothetical protein
MTVDTRALRASHVEGWRPRQSVELDVETLRALLDEVDELRVLAACVDTLTKASSALLERCQVLKGEHETLRARLAQLAEAAP